MHVRRRWCRPASMLPWWGLVHTSSPLLEVRIKIAQPTADQDNSPKYRCRRSDVVDDGVLDRFDLKYLNACGVATSYVGGRQNIFSSQPVSAVTTPLADAVSPSARGRLEVFTITPPGESRSSPDMPGVGPASFRVSCIVGESCVRHVCVLMRMGCAGSDVLNGGIHRPLLIEVIEHHLHRTLTLLDRVMLGHDLHPSPRRKRHKPQRLVNVSKTHARNRVDARMSFAGRRRRSPSR